MCVGLPVIFFKYPEQDIIAPSFFYQHGVLLLVSCGKWFSSRHNALLERETILNFFADNATMPFTLQRCSTLKISRLPEKGELFCMQLRCGKIEEHSCCMEYNAKAGWKLWQLRNGLWGLEKAIAS